MYWRCNGGAEWTVMARPRRRHHQRFCSVLEFLDARRGVEPKPKPRQNLAEYHGIHRCYATMSRCSLPERVPTCKRVQVIYDSIAMFYCWRNLGQIFACSTNCSLLRFHEVSLLEPRPATNDFCLYHAVLATPGTNFGCYWGSAWNYLWESGIA